MYTRDLGATAIKTGALTITTLAQKVGGAGDRSKLRIHNGGASSVFVGDATVTAATGYEITTGVSQEINAACDVYAVSAGSVAITFLEEHR